MFIFLSFFTLFSYSDFSLLIFIEINLHEKSNISLYKLLFCYSSIISLPLCSSPSFGSLILIYWPTKPTARPIVVSSGTFLCHYHLHHHHHHLPTNYLTFSSVFCSLLFLLHVSTNDLKQHTKKNRIDSLSLTHTPT